MIPKGRITEAENKDLHSLTFEDLLILRYWTSFKECRLWYALMKACDSTTIALTYAKKGKTAAVKTIKLQSEFKDLQIRKLSSGETKTIEMSDFNFPIDESKLKVLHLLFLNGSISKKVYDENCNNLMKKSA